jgi:dienelactone hydrolase
LAVTGKNHKLTMKHIITSVLIFYSLLIFGQKRETIIKEFTHFQISESSDNIDFIIADTSFNQKKPVFLFCQGSLPIPLFIDFEQGGIDNVGGGIRNFDLTAIKKNYYLVVISMPKTPLLVDYKHVNNSYSYIPDTLKKDEFDPEFYKADFLENYKNRGNSVIKYLMKQKWVDPSELVVAGHSQGSKVAIKIASSNKLVSKLGIFSDNPFGRIDQFVRQARKDAESGKINWTTADSIINSNYEFYRIVNDEKQLTAHPEYISWKSFSEPLTDDLVKIDIPIYLAYGTNDITSDLCDLIPLYFIENKKENLTCKRYPGVEHNFFEVDDKGIPDYNKGHWNEVMNEFLIWTKE